VKDWISGESRPPIKEGLRSDEIGIIREGQAASGHDGVEIVECLEMLVGDGFPGERPETFGRLDLRGMRGQDVQFDAFGDLQVSGDMPSGTINDEQHVLVGAGADLGGEGSKDGAEQGGVGCVGEEPDNSTGGRPHEAVDIEPLEAVMSTSDRAAAPPRPDFAQNRFQTEPLFVKGPDFNRKRWLLLPEFFYSGAEFF
jgi:hypothetical protein